MRRSPIRSLKLLSLSLSLSLAAALLLQTCVCQAEQANSQDDIYNALFLKMSADCPVYVANLTSSKTALVQYDGGAFANLFSTSSSVGISYNSANRTPQKFLCGSIGACEYKESSAASVNESERVSASIFQKMDLKNLSRDDYFDISEDGCMVQCPFYDMRILGDGTFNFQEHKSYRTDFAPIRGKLTPENTRKLFQTIADFGFENYAASPLECAVIETEHSSETMALFVSGRKSSFSHQHGCTYIKRKAELLQFESDLHAILALDHLLKVRPGSLGSVIKNGP